MAAGETITFSIPVERLAGFKRAMQETNAASREHGYRQMRLRHNGPPQAGLQSICVPIADRTQCLVCELLGYIQDIEDGRPFRRMSGSEKH